MPLIVGILGPEGTRQPKACALRLNLVAPAGRLPARKKTALLHPRMYHRLDSTGVTWAAATAKEPWLWEQCRAATRALIVARWVEGRLSAGHCVEVHIEQ